MAGPLQAALQLVVDDAGDHRIDFPELQALLAPMASGPTAGDLGELFQCYVLFRGRMTRKAADALVEILHASIAGGPYEGLTAAEVRDLLAAYHAGHEHMTDAARHELLRRIGAAFLAGET